MNKLLIIHFLIGPVLLVIAWLTKIFPPKNINAFYGYRTSRSMRSEEAWKEANKYSTEVMIRLALSTILVQVITYLLIEDELAVLLPAGFLVLGLIVLVFLTERHLKMNGFK